MKIAVTGANGFVGRHVVAALAMRDGVEVIASSRAAGAVPALPGAIRYVSMDLSAPPLDPYAALGRPDVLVHLAWEGLPNYRSLHHFESELPRQYRFLRSLIDDGLPSLLVTGTCYEYGMACGELSEDLQPSPVNPYGYAKTALLEMLQYLKAHKPFALTWARLFYMYGEGQAPTSLYSLLRTAMRRGDTSFPMSSGEQLRDYLPVEDMARLLTDVTIGHPDSGIINICSGVPTSVRGLVEQLVAQYRSPILLDRGKYSVPDYEPLAFWGSTKRLNQLFGALMRLSVIKRNVFANLIGTGLATLLTALITPLQINILGMEAYGVVGFIATLQVIFAAFDLGISSTLTRELAADASLDKCNSRDLLSTAATVYWCAAFFVGGLIAAFADPISGWWFHAEKLSPQLLVFSLRVIALYLALRWPAALYVGVLSGLQRMDVLNLVKVLVVVIRLVGGILVLLEWRSLEAFLVWTAFSAAFEVLAYWLACKRAFPFLPLRLGFSKDALVRVWKYSLSMNVLSMFAVVIVQLDKLLISKILPLEALGFYSLAYTISSSISLVIAALNSAVFPWLVEVHHHTSLETVRRRYYNATRGLMFFATLLTGILICYGHLIVGVWINKSVGTYVALPIIFLASGFWVSAVNANIYNVAIAYGKPGRHLRVGLGSFLPYLVLLIGLIHFLGISGAALAWLLLNIAYTFFLVPQLHRQILKIGVMDWVAKTIVPSAIPGIVSFATPALFLASNPKFFDIRIEFGCLTVSILIYLVLGYRTLRSFAHPASSY